MNWLTVYCLCTVIEAKYPDETVIDVIAQLFIARSNLAGLSKEHHRTTPPKIYMI